jgi:hypothetical protein
VSNPVAWNWWGWNEPREPSTVIVHGKNTTIVPFGFRTELHRTAAGPERRIRTAETMRFMQDARAEEGESDG